MPAPIHYRQPLEWTVRVGRQRRRTLAYPRVPWSSLQASDPASASAIDPRPNTTVFVFPGSTQTINRFLDEGGFGGPDLSHLQAWTVAGYNVVLMGSRRATGHTWLPVTSTELDTADLSFTKLAVNHFCHPNFSGFDPCYLSHGVYSSTPYRPNQPPADKPYWFFGHSGGGCFVYTLYYRYTMKTQWGQDWTGSSLTTGTHQFPYTFNPIGIVVNAGWAWPWTYRDYQPHSLANKPICLRVGKQDLLTQQFVEKQAILDASLHTTTDKLRTSLGEHNVSHRWVWEDDEALRSWMQNFAY